MTPNALDRRNKVIFISGATGFIGSHLAAEFLRNGCRLIALARPRDGVSPWQRLVEAITSVDETIEINDRNLLAISGSVEGDIEDWLRQIREKTADDIDEVWHLAAIFKIRKQTQEEVQTVNIGGVRRILEFVRTVNSVKIPRYFHVSTAYSQGRRSEIVAEEIVEYGTQFRSLYDWSKHEGEHLVKECHDLYGLDASILRPSIVVGSPKSDVVNDAAYYAVLETFYSVAKRAEVTMGDDFDGNIGVRFWCEPRASLNIVPIDFVVKAMILLSQRKSLIGNSLKIFNVVNEDPPMINFVRDIMCESLGVTGIETVTKGVFSTEPMTPLEKLVERRIAFQAPYARENTIFSVREFRQQIKAHELPPPVVDADFLRHINRAFITAHERKLHDLKGEQDVAKEN